MSRLPSRVNLTFAVQSEPLPSAIMNWPSRPVQCMGLAQTFSNSPIYLSKPQVPFSTSYPSVSQWTCVLRGCMAFRFRACSSSILHKQDTSYSPPALQQWQQWQASSFALPSFLTLLFFLSVCKCGTVVTIISGKSALHMVVRSQYRTLVLG